MSAGFRILVGGIGLLSGLAFLSMPFAFQKFTAGAWAVALGLGGVCFLLSIAALGGKFGRIAARVLGGLICLAYVAYFIFELGQPQPALSHWRRSQASLINAVLGFVIIGIPGAYYALKGRFRSEEAVVVPTDEDSQGTEDALEGEGE